MPGASFHISTLFRLEQTVGLRFDEVRGRQRQRAKGIFNEAAARSWKVAVPFLGMVALHLRGLRLQLGSPDESREVQSHSQNNCSCKTAPAQSEGREAEENQVSNALTVHHKGTIHGRNEGFSPCLSFLPSFIEPILNFVLICKSRAKTQKESKRAKD